jgi:hypothetical protein
MKCDRAHRIWFGSPLGINFNGTHTNFIDWLYYCLTTLKEEELCYLAAIIYGIWYARNKLVFENIDINDKRIIEQAYSSIKDYQSANQISNTTVRNNTSSSTRSRGHTHIQHLRSTQRNSKWRKPRAGRIKANCDANLSINGSWGLGAIFRDEEDQILASATWKTPGIHDPSTAEASALYLTMKLAIDCCFTKVEFESDCSNVIEGILEVNTNPRSYLGNLVKGIQLNRDKFIICTFHRIDRKANRVAHELASLAHSVFNNVWLEETHPLIVPFVHQDLF